MAKTTSPTSPLSRRCYASSKVFPAPKVLIRSEGCSRYFAVGLLDVPDAAALATHNRFTAEALDFIINDDTRLRDAAARQIKHHSVVKDFFTTAADGKTFETARKTRNCKR